MACCAIDQTDQAAAAYRKALEINPKFVDAQLNLGITLREVGQFAEAEECFQKVLDLDATHPLAKQNLEEIKITRAA